MSMLHNLSIRKKFAVVVIPLLLTIIGFDFVHIRHDYYDYEDSKRLNKAINISYQITHLLHELQRERSVSAGHITGNGNSFTKALVDQRKRTDSVFNLYQRELEDVKFTDMILAHNQEIDDFRGDYRKLDDFREMMDAGSLKPRQVIRYYSDINYSGLNLINSMISDSRDKYATQQVHAIIYFLESKEYASVERALGTFVFSSNEQNPDVSEEFAGLLSAQTSYIDAFLKISDKKSNDFYHETMQGKDVDELAQLRSLLFDNEILFVDPAYWHNVISKKIDSLKEVEEFLLTNMHNYTESLAATAWGNFWTFLMIDLLIAGLTLTLISSIATSLIRNVKKLDNFSKRVSKGDLSAKAVINTRDELGQYANTFNLMLNEIKKSHYKLRVARNKALHMYQNMSTQAKVVFENVEQGVFLLDKDIKISNLYSKAVERIFDNNVIANENFCNFMRPRIIQRDFEALQMFMKHLFNPDIDEDVVNQLNPIEQVKIFISTNGVVITKHLRVSFTRIMQSGVVQTILVTISDETEQVLLQQHMEEAEEKKKKETEYMLNVFKVEPDILSEFLGSTRKSLKSISEQYEKGASIELNELLKRTFEIIHKIKGNSMSIGLEVAVDKLHSIEESIVALKDVNVTPEKFIVLLYEIEELDKMLADMGRMLDKVSDAYKNFQKNRKNGNKNQLVKSLTSKLEVMSKEIDRKVELEVLNPDNIMQQENHMEPMNDILVQLMRNSLSHGIESPAERIEKGKSERGKIIIAISETDNGVRTISYQDDGKGLDLSEIRLRAIEAGIVTEQAGRMMSDNEIAELIFASNFTTSEQIDHLSGRGQGMGIIKSTIDELGGAYSIRFEKGRFFELTFTIPAAGKPLAKQLAEV